MFTVGPTLFSSERGDHTPNDGLTRLQTTFAGGSSADISSYGLGAGTLSATGATVYSGYLEIVQDSAVDHSLLWAANGLARLPSTAHTLEFFVKIIEVTNNPVPSVYFSEVDLANMAVNKTYVQGFLGGVNSQAFISPTWYTFAGTTDVYTGTWHHHALVWDTAGALSVYWDGVRQCSVASTGDKGSPYFGSVRLGSTGAAGYTTKFQFSGVRVRRAQMYTGASFTPPISPADWGPP